jgi:Flp pilus assembly protein TadG
MIETTLVVFLLLAFVMGMLDFGQYMYFHQSLSERARAAARYGAVNPIDRIGIQNVAVYNNPLGAASGARPLLPNFNIAMVSVCLPADKACADPSSGPGSRVTVTISGYRLVTFNPFMPRSFTNQPITASLPSEAPFS